MRHYQRGIATSIILVIFLLAGVAIASAYFVFATNLQKIKTINSFEDCAKYYPVMESYPEQCNTPDGKHFIRKQVEVNSQRVIPSPSAFPIEIDGQVWNDVGQITVLVNLFYAKYQRLPESINEILSDSEWSDFKLRNNPINNQPYVYKFDSKNKSFEVSGIQSNGVVYKKEIKID